MGLKLRLLFRHIKESSGMRTPSVAMTAHTLKGIRKSVSPPAWMAMSPSPFEPASSLPPEKPLLRPVDLTDELVPDLPPLPRPSR